MNDRVLFFIGAGFTKAVTGRAPTGNDFLVRAFDPSWSFASDQRIKQLRAFLEAVYHPLDDASRYPGIEDVLSLLNYSIQAGRPLSSDWDTGALRAVSEALVWMISQMIQESIETAQKGKKLHLSREFVEKLKGPRANVAVISTNYDIVLDNALLSRAKSCDYGILLRQNIELNDHELHDQTPIRPSLAGTEWHFQDRDEPQTHGGINDGPFRHLKLHGSLNWAYCPRCDEIDITIGTKGTSQIVADYPRWLCANPYCTAFYEPLLVTPTMLKVYRERALKAVFEMAEEEVSKADKLLFIGYSLPEADYLIRAMLIRGLAKNHKRSSLRILVIDKPIATPEDEKWRPCLEGRYICLLGPERLRFEFVGLDGLLKDFDRLLVNC